MTFPLLNGSLRNQSSLPAMWSAAEWYLDYKKDGYSVIAINQDEIQLKKNVKEEWLLTTIKILSYILIIPAAVAWATRYYYRQNFTYKVGDAVYISSNTQNQILRANITQAIIDSKNEQAKIENCYRERKEKLADLKYAIQAQRKQKEEEDKKTLTREFPDFVRTKNKPAVPAALLMVQAPKNDLLELFNQTIKLIYEIAHFQLDRYFHKNATIEHASTLTKDFSEIFNTFQNRSEVDETNRDLVEWEKKEVVPKLEKRLQKCAIDLKAHVIPFLEEKNKNPYQQLNKDCKEYIQSV